MQTTTTDTDIFVRNAVLRQLDSDPDVDASTVGVAAKSGTVILTGSVDSYAGKLAAARAARRVRGVRAVANDIEVRLLLDRTDADIGADVTRALELRSTIPESVRATVSDGHVTLTGTVDSPSQKRDAEEALQHLRGVRNILNHITLAPRGRVKRSRPNRRGAALR
jgi:osmotically-inducible protein OsmY